MRATTSPAAVAADVVALAVSGVSEQPSARGELNVLLARRERPPFEGEWALPGALVEADEDLEAAARRALSARGVATPASSEGARPGTFQVRHLEQLATFGAPGRDPRGRVLSVSYLALMPAPAPTAPGAAWWATAQPPTLAFDHAEILASAVERLRGKLSYSNVAFGLLPDTFTLSDLQGAYEAVLDRAIDKRNFRKRVLALGMLVQAQGKRRGSHRPAQLYRFAQRDLVLLDGAITT